MNEGAAVEVLTMGASSTSEPSSDRVPTRRADRPADRFPGWYPDPMTPGMDRFWDGLRWSDRVRAGSDLGELAGELGPIEPVLAHFLAS